MDYPALKPWAKDPERSVGSELRRLGRELGVPPAIVRIVGDRLKNSGIDTHEDAGPYLFAIRRALLQERSLREDLARVRRYLESVRQRLRKADSRTAGEIRVLDQLRRGLEERRSLLLDSLSQLPPRRPSPGRGLSA